MADDRFHWDKVRWTRPALAAPGLSCAYCSDALPADVTLVVTRNDGKIAHFCVDCWRAAGCILRREELR